MRKPKKFISLILSLIIVLTIIPLDFRAFALTEITNNYSSGEVLETELENQEDLYELIPGEEYIENEIIIKYTSETDMPSLDEISEDLNLSIECDLDSTSFEIIPNCVNSFNNEFGDGLYLASIDESDTVVDVVREI